MSGNDNMQPTPSIDEWLLSPENPVVRYLATRDLGSSETSASDLAELRHEAQNWAPLRQILDMQKEDGSFPYKTKTATAQPTFSALYIMSRCAMTVDDEPVARTLGYLCDKHLKEGAFSYIGRSGSGVLPCYVGEVALALIRMGGYRLPEVRSLVQWLVDYQRFDHKNTRDGGPKKWPFKAVDNHGGCSGPWPQSPLNSAQPTFRTAWRPQSTTSAFIEATRELQWIDHSFGT